MKKSLPPRPWLFPRPAVLISARGPGGQTGLMTASWIGMACSTPPMLTVGIRNTRFTHDLVQSSREFVVNITTFRHEPVAEFCGTESSHTVDKFRALGLGHSRGEVVNAPVLDDCPINLECRVQHVLPLGSHDLFVAEIVRVQVDPLYLDEKGELNQRALDGLAWGTSHFFRVTGPR
jgi:flavin reductase (DIM6/NTAB) family NADH-FMN oxidoreductase RutF